MMYRTVTVTPQLVGSVSVLTRITPNITVSPSISKEIPISAELHDGVISAGADLHESVVTVEPNYSTPVAGYISDVDYYEGPYEYTPTQAEQTIPIQGQMATRNITINPIPSNYGLITWDGRALTVS